MRIIDLTFLVETDMPTCGTDWHQNVEIIPMGTLEKVGRNTHSIVVGSHTGTHMDAPFHFIKEGNTIDKIDLNWTCGEIGIVDLRNHNGKVVTLEDIKQIKVSEKMLFVFGWYKKWKTESYYKDFPYFSIEAIEYLLEGGMRFMAMDTPSPDNGAAINEMDDSPNHKLLLSKEVVIVEYLCNTDSIDFKKKYEIYALPLKVSGSDGAPSRVILKEIN